MGAVPPKLLWCGFCVAIGLHLIMFNRWWAKSSRESRLRMYGETWGESLDWFVRSVCVMAGLTAISFAAQCFAGKV